MIMIIYFFIYLKKNQKAYCARLKIRYELYSKLPVHKKNHKHDYIVENIKKNCCENLKFVASLMK